MMRGNGWWHAAASCFFSFFLHAIFDPPPEVEYDCKHFYNLWRQHVRGKESKGCVVSLSSVSFLTFRILSVINLPWNLCLKAWR